MVFPIKAAFAAGAVLAAAVAAAGSVEWDFTKGLPPGGELRGAAELTRDGISVPDIGDYSRRDGFQLREKFAYPDAFRIEFDLVLRERKDTVSNEGVLWDDMYINAGPKRRNRGMQVSLRRYGKRWTPVFSLGLGGMTCIVNGPSLEKKDGEKVRIAADYGANRSLVVEFDGVRQICNLPVSGVIAPSAHPTVIAGRVGSNYYHAEACLSRVRITPLEREKLAVVITGRTVFERAEKPTGIEYLVENVSGAEVVGLAAAVRQYGSSGLPVKEAAVDFGNIGKGGSVKGVFFPETRIRPGRSTLEISLCGSVGGSKETVVGRFDLGIGPTFAERMPAVMWGYRSPKGTVADYGFTHATDNFGFRGPIAAGADEHAPIRHLDDALVNGLRLIKSIGVNYPGDAKSGRYYRRPVPELARRLAASKRDKPQPEVGMPEMVSWAREAAAADVRVFGGHPAFNGVLAVSEQRENAYPSLNTDAARFKMETGLDMPPEVAGKTLDFNIARKRFPDGIVPESDPLYVFYRWYWRGGDGWPAYFSAIADEYRRARGRYGDGSDMQRRSPFFSFHDPAVRQPPVWGNGGDLDVLSQWCYATPEPMNVAGPAEELFAMVEGNPLQQVMIMTQIICYRVHLAPRNVTVDPAPEWVRRRPEAAFPAIPPDVLQEATWSMIAKPVRGIMYHGWGCIYETGEDKKYCYTNPETEKRIRHLLRNVVAPLGPALLKIGRERNRVAVLESGVTAMFGGPASWGWAAPAITLLQRARLDPRVVYEEAVVKNGLDDVEVLYAPQFCMTTAKVVEKIREFQRRGGILVGDEQMLKALSPDITVPIVKFTAPPASDHTEDVEKHARQIGGDVKSLSATMNAKRIMQEQAEELRKALAEKGYRPASDSSSSEIAVYNRRWRNTPYVFAVNDKRTFGDYVGQWGKIMEKGLPFKGEVSLVESGCKVGAVYELSRGGKLAFSKSGNKVTVPLEYDTNDGRLLVFLPEEIAKVRIDAPVEIAPGGDLKLEFKVFGRSGKLVPAVLPVEVRLYDSSGREIDGAGYAAAEGGVCRMAIPVNFDDASGEYRLVCRDRASGMVAEKRIFRGKLPWFKRVLRKLVK